MTDDIAMLRNMLRGYGDAPYKWTGERAALTAAIAALKLVERVRVDPADIDRMRDVYMTREQRAAYDRIIAALPNDTTSASTNLTARLRHAAAINAASGNVTTAEICREAASALTSERVRGSRLRLCRTRASWSCSTRRVRRLSISTARMTGTTTQAGFNARRTGIRYQPSPSTPRARRASRRAIPVQRDRHDGKALGRCRVRLLLRGRAAPEGRAPRRAHHPGWHTFTAGRRRCVSSTLRSPSRPARTWLYRVRAGSPQRAVRTRRRHRPVRPRCGPVQRHGRALRHREPRQHDQQLLAQA